jgi:hypothetical protein
LTIFVGNDPVPAPAQATFDELGRLAELEATGATTEYARLRAEIAGRPMPPELQGRE